MRIHSDSLRQVDVALAAYAVSPHLTVETIRRGSRSRGHSIDVRMIWEGPKCKGDHRRHTNTGTYGAGEWAATWDEWGLVIDRLFDMDPDAIVGPYESRADFYLQTARAVKYRRHDKAPWLEPAVSAFG